MKTLILIKLFFFCLLFNFIVTSVSCQEMIGVSLEDLKKEFENRPTDYTASLMIEDGGYTFYVEYRKLQFMAAYKLDQDLYCKTTLIMPYNSFAYNELKFFYNQKFIKLDENSWIYKTPDGRTLQCDLYNQNGKHFFAWNEANMY